MDNKNGKYDFQLILEISRILFFKLFYFFKGNHRFYSFIAVFLSFFIFFGFMAMYVTGRSLTTNVFRMEDEKLTAPVRAVVLGDLHDRSFGEDNEDLVSGVVEQQPDMVLLVGDFVNDDSANAEVPCIFLEKLVEALPADVPVYFALGNHEFGYMASHTDEPADAFAGASAKQSVQQPVEQQVQHSLIAQLEATGVVVLDEEFVDLEVNGCELRLGGMYEYAFGLNGKDEAEAAPADVKHFLEEFQDTDRMKIMMSHRPDSFIFGNASSFWDVDLVVSGHVHGGQVVLPFVGGVYGMDQGWFPKFDHGVYELGRMQLFVTSGLGSGVELVPRLNNPPELAVLELVPAQAP